jgi:hypothetical protein
VTSSPADPGTGTGSGSPPESGDINPAPELPDATASGSTSSEASPGTSSQEIIASTAGASVATPTAELVESAPLELSGFTLASGGPTSTPPYRGLRSLAAGISLRARGFSGSDLLVQYSAGGRAWQDAGSVDLSAEASNALSGGYALVELPKQLMKDLGTLHLRDTGLRVAILIVEVPRHGNRHNERTQKDEHDGRKTPRWRLSRLQRRPGERVHARFQNPVHSVSSIAKCLTYDNSFLYTLRLIF